MLHEIHLQRAADAAVLKGHEAVVGLADDTPFTNQIGIDVDLADIVHDHGKPDSFAIVEYAVEQRCLAASKITREQEHGNFFQIFHSRNYVMQPSGYIGIT